jgi:hypothetical protein
MLSLVLLAAAGCNSGWNSGSGDAGPIPGDLSFDQENPTVTTNPAALSGVLQTFADPPGTQITWSNATTGGSGVGTNKLITSTDYFLGTPVTVTVDKWFATIPVVQGPNVVSITASDDQGRVQTKTATVTYQVPPPMVRIEQPWPGTLWNTMDSPLSMSGTASSPVGIASVDWSNDLTAAGGMTTGTTSWNAVIPLGSGMNLIRIRAVDTLGRSSTATMYVTYPSTNPPPSITLTTPASGAVTTSDESVVIYGECSSPFSITRIDCSCGQFSVSSSGVTLLGSGVTDWNFNVPLAPGMNVIQITACDGLGATTTTTVVATRTP